VTISTLLSLAFLRSKGNQVRKVFIAFRKNINSILSAYTTYKNKTLKNEILRRLIDVVILNKTGKGTFDLFMQPKILSQMVIIDS